MNLQQFLQSFLEKFFTDETVVFILSLLPVSEIRGGMIYAAAKDMNLITAFIISYIGNMLPIPFLLMFLRKVFAWMRKLPALGKIVDKLMVKAEHGSSKLGKYGRFGLFLLVAIPLPGTGAWTGALVADFVDMRMKYALPLIALGVLVAGIIVSAVSYGLFGLIF